MITRLLLKTASSPGQPALEVETPSVTIFVGPNNAGKSQALREIYNFCVLGQINSARLIVNKLIFEERPFARAEFDSIKAPPLLGEVSNPGWSNINVTGERLHVNDEM
jgi:hypothetical protein